MGNYNHKDQIFWSPNTLGSQVNLSKVEENELHRLCSLHKVGSIFPTARWVLNELISGYRDKYFPKSIKLRCIMIASILISLKKSSRANQIPSFIERLAQLEGIDGDECSLEFQRNSEDLEVSNKVYEDLQRMFR
jgi:hypothetical protein